MELIYTFIWRCLCHSKVAGVPQDAEWAKRELPTKRQRAKEIQKAWSRCHGPNNTVAIVRHSGFSHQFWLSSGGLFKFPDNGGWKLWFSLTISSPSSHLVTQQLCNMRKCQCLPKHIIHERMLPLPVSVMILDPLVFGTIFGNPQLALFYMLCPKYLKYYWKLVMGLYGRYR